MNEDITALLPPLLLLSRQEFCHSGPVKGIVVIVVWAFNA